MKVAYWFISASLFLVMIIAMVLYDAMTIKEFDKDSRLYILDKTSQLKTNLQSALNSNMMLLQGVSSIVHSNPNISSKEFQTFAKHLIPASSSVRNVSIIPGMVIRQVFPVEGNESAIGFDLSIIPEQKNAIDYIKETGHQMISGPLQLVQGGTGIIGRSPIFLDDNERPASDKIFWGSVSIVIDFHQLLEQAQFTKFSDELSMALRGKDGRGASGKMMFGDASIFQFNPVLLDIHLPQGNWQIGAIPKAGWTQLPSSIWLSRIVSLTVTLLIITIVLLVIKYNRDRKLSMQVLKREKDFSNAVLDTVGTVITVLNKDGEIVQFNSTAEDLTGYSAEELQDKPIWDYLIPKDQIDGVKNVFKNLTGGHFPSRYENHWKTRDGSQRLISWSNTALFDNDHNVEYVIATGIDITEQRKAELEREQLQHQLLQTQKMEAIGQLTGGIAHDFNNILASILGYTELAVEKYGQPDSGKLAEYLQHVMQSAQRARELVTQMLAFSRGDDSHIENINPIPAVQEAVHMLCSIIPASIQMDTQFEEELPEIIANSVELNQVIMNLAINSRDALDNQGKISIWIKHRKVDDVCDSCHENISGQFVEIGIKDNGSGIEPELIDHIFEPFFTTKDVGKGTGMGLSMVHGIIHSWNGHILVDSSPETGTIILLLIPAASKKTSTVANVSTSEKQLSTKKVSKKLNGCHNIMVIDDEISIGHFLEELLEMNQFCVDYFSDPKQALTKFRQNPYSYDLIITDQSMPGITGLQFIQQVAILHPDIPVILCTGYSEQIDENIVVQKTANIYLQKPLDTRQLISSINELIIE
ncbi:MAG: PAS domain S-box protein [Gammaproteobacteria bacterium]|nr:PAS domain S-box protein [Gammaproteobacteria bacterium]